MITKTGSDLIKEADILGAAVGGIRSANLTSEQRKALKEIYGLGDNASLGWRNAGRGFAGGVLGAIPGSLAGSAIGRIAGRGNPMAGEIGRRLGAAAGSVGGMTLATNKYSKGNPHLQ